jgi:hypothetical protein
MATWKFLILYFKNSKFTVLFLGFEKLGLELDNRRRTTEKGQPSHLQSVQEKLEKDVFKIKKKVFIVISYRLLMRPM